MLTVDDAEPSGKQRAAELAVESVASKARPNSMELAHAMRALKGRVVGGRRFVATLKQGVTRWSVEQMSGGVRGVGEVSTIPARKLSAEGHSLEGDFQNPTKPTYPTADEIEAAERWAIETEGVAK